MRSKDSLDYILKNLNLHTYDRNEQEYYYGKGFKSFVLTQNPFALDPLKWNEDHVQKWILWTIHQCNLPMFDVIVFRMSGRQLCKLTEKDMYTLAPSCGDILHARLDVWRAGEGCSSVFDNDIREIMSIMKTNPCRILILISKVIHKNNDF